MQAAQGQIPCDLVLRNVRYLDVFSCAWREGDIAVIDGGVIVGLERGSESQAFPFDAPGQVASCSRFHRDAHVCTSRARC